MTEIIEDYDIPEPANQTMINFDNLTYKCRFESTTENNAMIIIFGMIFFLSVIGNALVIIVIVQQRTMRSITNIYLLNLALTDLLLSAVCMPPTLVSMVFNCWIFGNVLCKLFAYLQPMVVTASAYTLAVIAFERYYAICRPLHSRIWQTRSHAYAMITLVWLISILANMCLPFMYRETTYFTDDDYYGYTCGPIPKPAIHFAYQVYMTVVLLLVPLIVMTVLYGKVITTLRSGIQMDIAAVEVSLGDSGVMDMDSPHSRKPSLVSRLTAKLTTVRHSIASTGTGTQNQIRSTHMAKTAMAKQRVIRMLLVVVVIFFCCWSPSYIYWLLIIAGDTFRHGPNLWHPDVNSVFTVLTYMSSCTNPITYCFLNKKFRTAISAMFGNKRAIRQHFQKKHIFGPPGTPSFQVYIPKNGACYPGNVGKANINSTRTSLTGEQSVDLNESHAEDRITRL